MEILGEILAVVFQVLGELVIQVVMEALAELGLRAAREPFRLERQVNPLLAVLGYLILGAAVGGLSLLMFPASLVDGRWPRILNLVATPILAGLVMGALGAWRRRRDQDLIRIDRFGYGFAFALAMALVRFFWARGG